MKELSTPEYWNNRYTENNDTWTLNNANPVLVQAVEHKLITPPGSVLTAGCGKGDDSLFLSKQGFEVTAVDFSANAIEASSSLFKRENANVNLVQTDLFRLNEEFPSRFDYLYEYVTLCAVEPARVEEMIFNFAAALKPGGLFIADLFPVDGRKGGPPFSIDLKEFVTMTSKYLKLEHYSRLIKSIKPRKGNEVLMIFRKEK